jgi:hypothetical protein
MYLPPKYAHAIATLAGRATFTIIDAEMPLWFQMWSTSSGKSGLTAIHLAGAGTNTAL